MGLKESLKRLQEQELLDKKLSLKREVKKELTKLKNKKILEKKCATCGDTAKYSIKGSNDWYCKDCAIEYFGDLKHLKKTSINITNINSKNSKSKNAGNIYFITNNIKKFMEISQIIPDIEQLQIDLEEIQEVDARKIIEHKLLEAKKKFNEKNSSFMVEDISVYFECMNGLPGPLIKWFLQTIGNKGLHELTVKLKNNKAEARTMIGYYNKGKIKYFQGIIKGRITNPRSAGSGWDEIFIPEGYDETFSEMTREEKNEISMRGQAAEKLKKYLEGK
jgi:non-canonical purine NTP pyrophosphatase (RdgB/HAM1 family)